MCLRISLKLSREVPKSQTEQEFSLWRHICHTGNVQKMMISSKIVRENVQW